jgi:hypothetical protein
MSGRIRTIKPELLEDEKTARLSDRAWRVFVSLIIMADDYGNMRGSERYVSGAALWAHAMPDIGTELADLEDAEIIRRYSVKGESYIHLTNWSKHQRIDKPGRPRVPGPDADDDWESVGEPLTYIARRGADGPIKIGFSVNPESRAEQLSRQQPEKVVILATLPGRKHEKALHRRFADSRIAGTEWFEPTKGLLDFLTNLSMDAGRPQSPERALEVGHGRPVPTHGQEPERELSVAVPAENKPGEQLSTTVHGRPMSTVSCPIPRARVQDMDLRIMDMDLRTMDHGVCGQTPHAIEGTEDSDPWGLTPTRDSKPTPKRKREPKRARQLPDDWQPNEGHHSLAKDLRVTIGDELPKFCDHHRAKGSTFKDWDAAFRTWLRNAQRFAQRPVGAARPRSAAPIPRRNSNA